MKVEIEKVFDIAELFTGRAKALIFPIDPNYLAATVTDALSQVAPDFKFEVKWTGKRFALTKAGTAFHGKNFNSPDEIRRLTPEFFNCIGMINHAKLTCFQGQVPIARL